MFSRAYVSGVMLFLYYNVKTGCDIYMRANYAHCCSQLSGQTTKKVLTTDDIRKIFTVFLAFGKCWNRLLSGPFVSVPTHPHQTGRQYEIQSAVSYLGTPRSSHPFFPFDPPEQLIHYPKLEFYCHPGNDLIVPCQFLAYVNR